MLAWYPGDNFRQVIPAWFAQHNYFPLPGCLDRCSLYLYHAEVELLRKKNRHNNVVRSTNPELKLEQRQGSIKEPYHCPGQVDFLSGKITFHSHLPDQ